jgi:acyl transferase domain-containing protein
MTTGSTQSCAVSAVQATARAGITAPNPVGQRLAVERAWTAAGISPAECTLIEGHGTSTRVGDVVEVSSLMDAFSGAHLPRGSVALGSVKSNIGHLKAAAGAAGMLKASLALRHKVLPPPPRLRAAQPQSGLVLFPRSRSTPGCVSGSWPPTAPVLPE